MTERHLTTPSGKPRARALDIHFGGEPGPNNAITDVEGVAVGYTTLIRGEGPLVVGNGPVRTGVTAVLPRGHDRIALPVFAGYFSLNGNGELTGTIWIEESGQCNGPITITNTHSCGLARDATVRWLVENHPKLVEDWMLPVAGETYDGYLNDINGFHVREEHVFDAIESARSGPIEEGSVGGGTGMICYEFKGGSGTASRRVAYAGHTYIVGAFLQANFGRRGNLTIAGAPVGRHFPDPRIWSSEEQGSVIGIIATDAPFLPHQLKRLARRAGLGIGRSGSVSAHGSGDIFLAFSTANAEALAQRGSLQTAGLVPDADLDPFFEAVVEATDEAVINALVANETMRGRDGRVVEALPHDALKDILRGYGRLAETG